MISSWSRKCQVWACLPRKTDIFLLQLVLIVWCVLCVIVCLCVCVHMCVTAHAHACAEAGVHARVCMHAHVTACVLTTCRMGDVWLCVYMCVGWGTPGDWQPWNLSPFLALDFFILPKKVRTTKATQAQNWWPRALQDPWGNEDCWQNRRAQASPPPAP